MKTPGEIAFDAYCNFANDHAKTWKELTEITRDAWNYVANKVIEVDQQDRARMEYQAKHAHKPSLEGSYIP